MQEVPFSLDMTTAGASGRVYVRTDDYDTASIHTYNPEGTSFNSGVISVKKSNMKAGGQPAALSTPMTISAPGLVPITSDDWRAAGYITLECTTGASSATRVNGVVVLTKLGFDTA